VIQLIASVRWQIDFPNVPHGNISRPLESGCMQILTRLFGD
jgi:hypothetical protein